ncbi:DegQ family serine endoprotease [Beggiatoa leptomitoformis]|uniref:Probable periplasmic serine endoprotease DegP-like n=1 Tax=Beggiatoa leptomitoformis TaxID=288004 RepID=A0A2N9YBX4_9GAMM|nr:DegQ family serine endoprotease [Beggiatoa leptomitoformis]ALG66721.1 Do family serine endopeptidase [Beggiatoa leptomitoformis]AUI67946.1 Do family serine endopeptidase [Beggiatoa leptomitoformis]
MRYSSLRRNTLALFIVAALGSTVPYATTTLADTQNLSNLQTMPASFADLVEKVQPAVVSIAVESKLATSRFSTEIPEFPKGSPFEEFFRRFQEEQSTNPQGRSPEKTVTGLGSGFVIAPDGKVVTNYHVIKDADGITVTLHDESKYTATVIGFDEKTDLALLQIDAKKTLPYVSFGDSNKTRVGDWVIAVGNPFGLGDTFTAGILSARGRDINSGPYDDFLQFDAPINRGNSGGPLFNNQGDVVGINTAIYSPTGGSVGIGFAIPANTASTIIQQLRETGSVSRGWLGVQIQPLTDEIAESLGLSDTKGALVADLLPESPARKAGVQVGDVVTAVDDKIINQFKELPRFIASGKAGEVVKLTIWRGNKSQTVAVTLSNMPTDTQVAGNAFKLDKSGTVTHNELGLKLTSLTEKMRKQHEVAETTQGVLIVDVANNSPAADVGLQAGDVIVMVGQMKVSAPAEVIERIGEAIQAKRQSLLLLIDRQGDQRFITVKLQQT